MREGEGEGLYKGTERLRHMRYILSVADIDNLKLIRDVCFTLLERKLLGSHMSLRTKRTFSSSCISLPSLACITQATGLEPEDQELIFCGLCLGNSLSTLGDALVLQSAMRHSPAVIQLDHRKKRSVSLSQNAGLVQHNSLPSRNQDQDMQQKQGSMLQEAGEHDLSLQGRWDMYSRISHTGAPELDTLELLYKEQHMALSQMYELL